MEVKDWLIQYFQCCGYQYKNMGHQKSRYWVVLQEYSSLNTRILSNNLAIQWYYIRMAQLRVRLFLCNLNSLRRVTHIRISEQTIIGSDNGLSPQRRQAIIWTNVGTLLIGPLGTDFSEILIEINISSFRIMRLKIQFAKRHLFCFSLNVLNHSVQLPRQIKLITCSNKFPAGCLVYQVRAD